MNLNISQLQSFDITATWGSCTHNIQQTGSLKYDSTGLYLSLKTINQDSKHNTPKRLFGIGILSGSSKNGNEFMESVRISLSGLTISDSKDIYSNKGQISYVKYAVISAFIGDFFVTDKIEFKTLKFFPTNFSNWLQGNINNPIYSIDTQHENEIDISISSSEDNNYLRFYSPNLKFGITRYTEAQNAKEYIDHATTAILVRNSIDFYDAHADIQKLLLRNVQVSNWFKLLSEHNEFNYRVIGQAYINDELQEVQMFNFKIPSFTLNKYEFITTWQRRTINWGKTIIKSLNSWICNYEQLMPIFNTISPSQNGDLDQCLQEECVGLESIFNLVIGVKEYKKEHNLKHKDNVTYKDKVAYLLSSSFNQELVNKAFTSINKYDENTNNMDDLAEQIKSIRNSLSHSTSKNYTLFIKSIYREILKALIRDWILSRIGINRGIINSGYTGKTFNYSSITAWHD